MNDTLVISAISAVALLLFVAIGWYLRRVRRLERAAYMVSEISTRHDELKARAKMVENSAVGYVNSIGKDGAYMLEKLHTRIGRMTYLIEELESLLVSGDQQSIQEVELFLCNNHPRQMSPERGYDGTERMLRYDPDWDVEIESILQKLGESISQASIAATAIGVPKRRERKSTLMNLLDAGINLIRSEEQDDSESEQEADC